jgi:hypothetical protein
MNVSDRLHQLNCERLSPPSCGGGELKGAEHEEETLLTARWRHTGIVRKGAPGSARLNCKCKTLANFSTKNSGARSDQELARLMAVFKKGTRCIEQLHRREKPLGDSLARCRTNALLTVITSRVSVLC